MSISFMANPARIKYVKPRTTGIKVKYESPIMVGSNPTVNPSGDYGYDPTAGDKPSLLKGFLGIN